MPGFVFAVFLSIQVASGVDPIRPLNNAVKAAESPPAGMAGPSPKMLERYLLERCKEHFDARRKAVAALKTREDIIRRQQALRAFLIGSLGDLPDRTPLNPRVVGHLDREAYRIEKVIFESRPGHHVTAALYLPHAKPPFPGVLVPCGHSENGKAAEAYQRVCILLARSGMAALCYDPIGQGERVQMLDSEARPAIRQGSTTEHTLAGIGAMLVGRQLASYRIWDGIRALDYLASRPEIDPARLGCTGNSGGGTLTSYLMAIDDRITVAAPSCYLTSLERLFATIGPQDAEQNITGQVAAGLDHADYVTLRAPKPTLLCVGTQDFFDIQGSWDTFREVKGIYGRLGFGERVDLFESDEPHGFTGPRRVASVRWLRRWLLKIDDAIIETDSAVEPDLSLRCTPTGQVLTDPRELSVFKLNAARDGELRSGRARFRTKAQPEEFRWKARELLGLAGSKHHAAKYRLLEEKKQRGCRLKRMLCETEPGIVLPLISVEPERLDRTLSVLVKVGAKWADELAADGPVEAQVMMGRRVVFVDLRGMGELAPPEPASGRKDSPLGSEVKEAFLSFHLARPLLGQRVADLLSILDRLASEDVDGTKNRFEVVGKGPAGLIALHAGLLDERGLINKLSVEDSLISWADVVDRRLSRNQLASVVPGVLQYYDLPDLASKLAPMPLTIVRPVDAEGRPVAQAELDRVYSACREAYGTGDKLLLRAAP